jgi:hypothetical protein
MAVIEQEQMTTSEQVPERAIFVAADGRRARRLRRAGFAVALVACLWVVGLGVGMLGFRSLPGVSLVKEQIDEIAGTSGDPGSRPTENVSAPASRRSAPDDESRLASRSSHVAAQPQSRTRPVRSRPASRPPARAIAPPAAAQQPVNPATRERGWSRRGSTAPPGQVRKTVTPPPPSTRGQRRGQDPTAPPPVPPGQEKKAQTLPPLPPPSKKA